MLLQYALSQTCCAFCRIMFFKNIALIGALFVILDRPAKLKSKRE